MDFQVRKLFEFKPSVKFSIVLLGLGIIFTVFALLLVITPYMLPSSSLNLGERGKVNIIDFQNETGRMPAGAREIYAFGDIMCHQHASRSYFLNGNQMPFCARCTGIFFGLAIGTLVLSFVSFDIKIWLIFLLLVPMGVDGVAQDFLTFLHYESTNPLRVLTGFLGGIALALAVGFIVRSIAEIWKMEQELKVRI
ncbi:MAG: DUF2085 domain-containing protein [Thermoplasmata archaeon]|nr:DUF2085 domain-containing protein [Thermoplasmata archaeon]